MICCDPPKRALEGSEQDMSLTTQRGPKWVQDLLLCPFFPCAAILSISVFSLLAALTAQYVFGLQPCVLCLYQRVPFLLTTLFGLAGLLAVRKGSVRAAGVWVGFSALAFAVNAGIAFYHSGVERHWWRSAFEACRVGDFSASSPQGLLETLLRTPDVPCDVIPWADPILGLSMANYNALMCAGLALFCAVYVIWMWRRGRPIS